MQSVARPAPDTTTLTPSATQPHPLELTAQERAVFEVLCEQRGRVVSRHELARRAGLGELSPRRCDSLIVGIRRSYGVGAVRTVRRRGWMLVD